MASKLLPLLLAQSWQLALLIGGVLLANRTLGRDRPHLAHALWLVVLLKCLAPPLFSSPSGVFCWLQPQLVGEALQVESPKPMLADLPPAIRPDEVREVVVALSSAPVDWPGSSEPALIWNWTPFLVLIWLGGAALSLIIAATRWGLFLRGLSRHPRRAEPELEAQVIQLSRRLRVGRRVRLLVTQSRIGPAVIGLVRPTILLPAAIVRGKSPHDLEPILAHELLHVRRGDLWLAAAQVLSQALWWFHPLVWIANRLLTREAERCCDEQVLGELRCEPARYARSLLDILEQKHALVAVPAFPGVRPVDVTSNRLERIMRLRHGCRARTPWWCWLVLLLAAGATLPGAAFVVAAKERPAKLKPWRTQALPESNSDERNSERITRVYHVRDLLDRLAAELNTDEAAAREDLRGHVIGFAALKDPQLGWDGKKLVASHTAAQHERISSALAQLRQFGVRQVVLSVRLISGPSALLDKFPVKWSAAGNTASPPSTVQAAFDFEPLPLPGDARPGEAWTQATSVVEKNMPVLYAVLGDEQVRPLVEAIQGDRRANILQAPKVTVFNGQRATVVDATQRPFVVGVQPAAGADPNAPTGFEPQIRVVNEGTTLRMRPLLKDRQLVRLDYDFTLASIRSVETAKIPQGAGAEPLTVQVPEVASTRLSTSLDLPLGQTLAVGALTKQGPRAEAMVVLVEVREIDLASETQAARESSAGDPALPTARAVAPAAYLPDDVWHFPAAPTRKQTTTAESAVDKALQKRISLKPGNRALKEVVAQVSRAIASNIVLDPAQLAAEGLTAEWLVDVPAHGGPQPASDWLRQLLQPLGLGFHIENEAIRITSIGEVRQKPFTKAYQVGDVLDAVPSILAIGEGKPFAALPGPGEQPDFQPLLDLIRTTIAPQSWSEAGGPGSLAADEKSQSLVVSQTPEVHEQISDLLEQFRRLRDQRVELELKLLTVAENVFERTGLDFDLQQADDDVPAIHARLSREQAVALSRATGLQDQAVTRLSLLNGQGAVLDMPLAGGRRKVNLKLIPQMRADLTGIRLTLMAGGGEAEATPASVAYRCNIEETLLLDITDNIPAVGLPMLSKLPSVGRLFQQSPPAGSRVFLLVAPQILFNRPIGLRR